MYANKTIWLATGQEPIYLNPAMANRHGLIAGATGTGKTVTMKVLAESFSAMGVPVFMADIKGDVSGMCQNGDDSERMRGCIQRCGITDWSYSSFPTRFWDIFGEQGHPVRVTVSEMGPVLLSRLLGLTEVQSGVLDIVFRVADDQGMLLLDMKDLRAMLQFVGDNRKELTLEYGNVSTASIGAIQRALLRLQDEGGDFFFGEPALDIRDWMRTDFDGRGYINILNSVKLVQSPTLYSTFLLWMLTELFERLPEVGDMPRPRMIFFFDEAHLLFNDAPKALVQKIIQVVKLIRSKGVGVYFVTQNPADIPDEVLAQLSNRIQHALRAYTPSEQKAVRAAAQAFRENPDFKTADVITELGVGEALVSCLDDAGIPAIVQRAYILPPQSCMGPASDAAIKSIILSDEFELKYRESFDRESAYEVLQKAVAEAEEQRIRDAEEAQARKEEADAEKARLKEEAAAEKARLKEEAAAEKAKLKEEEKAAKEAEKKRQKSKKTIERAVTNAASSVTTSVTTNLVNSVIGGKKSDGKTIAGRAAKSALGSLLRSGGNSIIRGLFGNIK